MDTTDAEALDALSPPVYIVRRDRITEMLDEDKYGLISLSAMALSLGLKDGSAPSPLSCTLAKVSR